MNIDCIYPCMVMHYCTSTVSVHGVQHMVLGEFFARKLLLELKL